MTADPQPAPVPVSAAMLRDAWEDVLRTDADDGQLAGGVERFHEDADERLSRLEAALQDESWRPHPLTEVLISVNGKERVLHIPSVEDRIVARALLHLLTPLLDPLLGCAAHAYRRGMGVRTAVADVVAMREEGWPWVLRTDIDDCFPSIAPDLAYRRFAEHVDDPWLLGMVNALLRRRVLNFAGTVREGGLPQGCPLSPLLMNLVLAPIDRAIQLDGFPVVRYADDIVIGAADRRDAERALQLLRTQVGKVALSLGEEDTAVMSFEEGFTFVGEDFGPRYPPDVSALARADAEQSMPLFIAKAGAHAWIERGRLLVGSKDDVELLDVPQSSVSRILCFGAVGISAGLRVWAMKNRIPVIFASRSGTYQGELVGQGSMARASRLRAQLAPEDAPHRLALARAVVTAKVHKQITVLLRFTRHEHRQAVVEAVSAMEHMLGMLPQAATLDEIIGMEGASAAKYFPAYGSLFPAPLQFSLRSRRPPMDVPNSALSYLYTVLTGEAVTACRAAGLDPEFGMLHRDHDNRPSLALDLMEEFRPWVVDQVVLELARRGSLTTDSARTDESRTGVWLTKTASGALLEAYEQRMLTTRRGAIPHIEGSLRRHLYAQASRLARAIMEPTSMRAAETAWRGASWRP